MSTSAIAIPQTPPQRSLELNTFAEVMKFAEVVATWLRRITAASRETSS
jgi:hypothetical protein